MALFQSTLLLFISLALCSASIVLPEVHIPSSVSGLPSESGNYHPGRLLVTLHRPPPLLKCHSGDLPEGLDLHHVIDNSHAGDAHTHAAPHAEDIILVAQIINGLDAADMLDSIRDHPEVKHVELDAYLYSHKATVTAADSPQVHPNDVFYECNVDGMCSTPVKYVAGQQWGLTAIGAAAAWSYTTGSSAVKVGIIDTGISIRHQDLAANTDKNCQDFANGDGSCDEGSIPGPSKGHGTHAAGLIGGVGNNAMGVVGVNWHSKLVGCTMFSDSCTSDKCEGSTSAAIKCLNWLRNVKGVRIVSNSYGCRSDKQGCYSSLFERSIKAFGAQGGLFVVSAGNDGVSNDAVPHYPASYKSANVMSVAATSVTKGSVFWDTNNPEYMPDWSDYGMSVDLAAPGGDMTSTWAPASSLCEGSQDCYARISGTSAAAPMVAGAAALIASMPGAPQGAALKALILKHVDLLPSLKGKVKSGGRLNVFGPVLELASTVKRSASHKAPPAPRKGRKSPSSHPKSKKVSTSAAKPAAGVKTAAAAKPASATRKKRRLSPSRTTTLARLLSRKAQRAAAPQPGRRRLLTQ